MATFTVEIKDSDKEIVLTILKKSKAKVVETPSINPLTKEIATALQEIKEIQLGNIKPLSLKDI